MRLTGSQYKQDGIQEDRASAKHELTQARTKLAKALNGIKTSRQDRLGPARDGPQVEADNNPCSTQDRGISQQDRRHGPDPHGPKTYDSDG
jgi:hypothetical protein